MHKCGWLILAPVFIFLSCNRVRKADLIITNAVVYSVDSTFGIYQAFAVKDGRILETGTAAEIARRYSALKTMDMEGRPVYPGLMDAHCHFYQYGLGLQEADLTGTRSFDEIIEIVKAQASKYPTGWIVGRGWDQNDWADKTFPGREELDRLFPDRPVALVRIDGHAILANEKALHLANVDTDTRVEGGEIMRNKGKLTGVLIDNAMSFIYKAMPVPGESHIRHALLDAQEKCFGVGLTSLHDAGLDANIIDIIDALGKEDSLKIRIYAMLSPGKKNFEAFMYKGIYRTDRLHVGSIKMYADGALGSRGARLLKPYSDDPDSKGFFVSDPSFIMKMAKLADSCGYQVNTHCIGDAANDTVLKIYGSILKGKNDKRWRIEHAQVLAPGDFSLFSKFSIVPSVQPTHATSDMYWARDRLGDRVEDAYAYGRLLQECGWIADGSDFPVESINPIYGFYAAFTRKDRQGYPEGGFQPQDSLSREQALKAMTTWAARAAFEEDEKGSIEAGKFADFVVLDRDIMRVPPRSVIETKVVYTFIGGEMVYSGINTAP